MIPNPTSLTVEQLLSCPFCGSDQTFLAHNRSLGDTVWEAGCKACYAIISRDLESHAIAAWNTRHLTSTDRLRDALRAISALGIGEETPASQNAEEWEAYYRGLWHRASAIATQAIISTPAPTRCEPGPTDCDNHIAFTAGWNAGFVEGSSDGMPGHKPTSIVEAFSEWRMGFLSSLRSPAPTGEEEEQAYQTGKQDGFSEAVQQIDKLTGGDGEYRYCLGARSENHCPDPETMIQRIVDRFPAPSGEREALEQIAEMMGKHVENWPNPKKLSTAIRLIDKTLKAAVDHVSPEAFERAPKHHYWSPGDPDCPRDIKAGDGNLHTLRCKVCGLDDPRNPICDPEAARAALQGHAS